MTKGTCSSLLGGKMGEIMSGPSKGTPGAPLGSSLFLARLSRVQAPELWSLQTFPNASRLPGTESFTYLPRKVMIDAQ